MNDVKGKWVKLLIVCVICIGVITGLVLLVQAISP